MGARFRPRGRRLLPPLIGATLLLAASATAWTADASSLPGWRITFTTGPKAALTRSQHLAAVGPRDAFADWVCSQACTGGQIMSFSHWNGRSWRKLPWPAALHPYQAAIQSADTMGASSADNLWVFKDNLHTAGVLRWNGRSWSVSKIPAWVLRLGGAGFFDAVPVISGPKSAWVFNLGFDGGPDPTPAMAAREINGRWFKVKLRFVPWAVGAAGPNDIWVAATREPAPGQHLHFVMLHWDGHRWTTVAAPSIAAPRDAVSFVGAPAVAGPKSLWLVSTVQRSTSSTQRVWHWNGRVWRPVAGPAGAADLNTPAPDGAGGIWVAGNAPAQGFRWYFYHYSHGRWAKIVTPGPAGRPLNGEVSTLASVPGTTTMLAAGDVNISRNAVLGAVWQFGR